MSSVLWSSVKHERYAGVLGCLLNCCANWQHGNKKKIFQELKKNIHLWLQSYYKIILIISGAPKRPLICWPHGGPHSASCNSYSMAATYFVALGYSVVFVNYRGSLGFGQDGVDSLLGNCGLTDVDDVHKATLNCLKRYS